MHMIRVVSHLNVFLSKVKHQILCDMNYNSVVIMNDMDFMFYVKNIESFLSTYEVV